MNINGWIWLKISIFQVNLALWISISEWILKLLSLRFVVVKFFRLNFNQYLVILIQSSELASKIAEDDNQKMKWKVKIENGF